MTASPISTASSNQNAERVHSCCLSKNLKPKKVYPSKNQAEKRAKTLLRETGQKLWAYQCTHDKWHLTSKRPAKRSYKRKDGKRNR